MDRRELLATGGVSLIAIAGCLGTYEVVRQTGLMPDGSDSGSESDGDSDGIDPQPSDDDVDTLADSGERENGSPLEDGVNSENESEPVTEDNESNDSDELYEPDDGPLLDEENKTASNETESGENETADNSSAGNGTESNDSGEVPEDRPENPTEHVTWDNVDHEIYETEYGDSEVIVYGEIRNDTGYDLSYLRVGARGYLDGEFITENTIEIAGLSAGETLTVEIPLYVEPEAIDEYRHGVFEAAYVDE